jgi:hypothetical protein
MVDDGKQGSGSMKSEVKIKKGNKKKTVKNRK